MEHLWRIHCQEHVPRWPSDVGLGHRTEDRVIGEDQVDPNNNCVIFLRRCQNFKVSYANVSRRF